MALLSTQSRAILPRLWHDLSALPDDWVNSIAGAPIASDQASEQYGGLGAVADLREWKGPRQAEDLREITFTISNVKYEATLRVTGEEIRRDKTMQVERRIQDLVRRYNNHWQKLASTLLINGESTACYDAQFFFDTDHSERNSGTQNNDLTYAATTGTTPTVAEMEDAILEAVEALMGFKDDQGLPINQGISNFTVMSPIALMKQTAAALNAQLLESGRSNIIQAIGGVSFSTVFNPFLTDAAKFYVFVNDGRSLIRQTEVPLKVSAKAEGSEFEFDHDAHEYGIMTSRGIGYGNWQSAVLTTFT